MSTTSRSLLSYLTTVRSTVFGPGVTGTTSKASSQPSAANTSNTNGSDNFTLVMGNTSADLDSFISAVLVSWFWNSNNGQSTSTTSNEDTTTNKSNPSNNKHKTFVPLLNLPDVKSSELWRLRPEYGAALRLAVGGRYAKPNQKEQEQEKTLLSQLITIADIRAEPGYALYSVFASADTPVSATEQSSNKKQSLFLVDHNAPIIAGFTNKEIASQFEVVGCIDHHVDEQYVSPTASPRIITTGIGSCSTLVVDYFRTAGMWPDSKSQQEHNAQVARLALAPILIDTSNLQATGDKCSDTDRETVPFLESYIPSKSWNRDQFFELISDTKADSLKLLTPQEMFDRDFKDWTERNEKSGKDVKIGIASLVKPLGWIADHEDPELVHKKVAKKEPDAAAEQLVKEILSFVSTKSLGLLVLLTRASHHRKEIIMISFSDEATTALEIFGMKGRDEFQLGDWLSNDDKEDKDDDDEMKRAFVDAFSTHFGQGSARVTADNTGQAPSNPQHTKLQWRIWYQHDTSKSRKQVAPMIRDAVIARESPKANI